MKTLITFFITFIFQYTQAQPKIENLVFEGAGIRGLAYAGVVKELETRNLLPGIKRVGGTSAGAIIALLISLHYTSSEIEDIIGGTAFKKFNVGLFFFAGGVNRLNKYFGWYRGNRFEKWLSAIINDKTGNGDITFLQAINSGFKELYITGTNLNEQKLVVFSWQSFPNMKLKDAVRISMSIPLYFEPLFMNDSGRIIKRPKDKSKVSVMVDGGIIANYPIKIFDDTGAEKKSNFSTLGFRIDADAQIKNDKDHSGLAPVKVGSLKEYMNAFYTMIIENLNRQTLTAEDWQRTVSISDGGFGPRIRKLSKEEIATLVENGRKVTAGYFSKNYY